MRHRNRGGQRGMTSLIATCAPSTNQTVRLPAWLATRQALFQNYRVQAPNGTSEV